MGKKDEDKGLEKGLTSYGDRGFSLFLFLKHYDVRL